MSTAEPEIIRVEGIATGSFAALREVFARAIAAQGGGGAALAVMRDGEVVVDLVGGDYSVGTLQLMFSVSKALTAIVAAHAHEAGVLDLDEPLRTGWPEFGRSSTADITPRMVLSHRSGIASLDRKITLAELLTDVVDEAVSVQEPFWQPGTRHGYHSFTFGPLMDGVFRRRMGLTVGGYLAREITGPRGLDIWLGLPEDVFPRVARITYSKPAISESRAAFVSESGIPAGTTAALARSMDIYNHPSLLRAGFPSTSGVASARSLATLFAATLEGPLLGEAGRRMLRREQSRGLDVVLGIETAFSSGMQLPFPQFPLLGPRSYGHEAAGGSFAFADPDEGLALAWTTNVYPRMAGASPAGLALVDTLRRCLRNASAGPDPRRNS